MTADLFDCPEIALVSDGEGGVRLRPGFVDEATADRWFEALRSRVPWARQRRPMYDRVVDVPRLLASFPVDALPADLPLAEMLERVKTVAPAPYNAVGLNLYRDGADSVAMHNDKLDSIVAAMPIALISLGASRRMTIRAKSGRRQSLAVTVGHGSLLLMSHAAQSTHDHGIPKTRRAVGPRISVVFRVRPPDWRTDG